MARAQKPARAAVTPAKAKAAGKSAKAGPAPKGTRTAAADKKPTAKVARSRAAAPASRTAAPRAATPPSRSPARATASGPRSTRTAAPARTATAKAPARAATAATSRTPARAAATAATSTTPARKATAKVSPAPKSSGRRTADGRRIPADKFLAEQQELLLQERANHLQQAEELKEEADALAAEMEPGESEFGEEGGEGGNLSIERELDLVLSAQAKAAVDEIERALGKIDNGTYGICEKCGKEIPRARLKVLPHAPLCVACKSGGLSRR